MKDASRPSNLEGPKKPKLDKAEGGPTAEAQLSGHFRNRVRPGVRVPSWQSLAGWSPAPVARVRDNVDCCHRSLPLSEGGEVPRSPLRGTRSGQGRDDRRESSRTGSDWLGLAVPGYAFGLEGSEGRVGTNVIPDGLCLLWRAVPLDRFDPGHEPPNQGGVVQ